MKHVKLFEEFTKIGPASDSEVNNTNVRFADIFNEIEDMYPWSYVEHEGPDRIRFDWKGGQLSFWLNSDLTGDGDLPARIKDKIDNLGIKVLITEGKILRGALKATFNLALFIKKFKSLFNKTMRTELFKNIKAGDRVIDLTTFMKDNNKWMTDENLGVVELKLLAKNMGIEKEYPTMWDIFKFKYEKEFGRSLKTDLDIMEESLDEPYKGTNPAHITFLKDMKEMVKGMKEFIK